MKKQDGAGISIALLGARMEAFRSAWGYELYGANFWTGWGGEHGPREPDQLSSILLEVYERGLEWRYTRLFGMCVEAAR
jgi:hypothetical protein